MTGQNVHKEKRGGSMLKLSAEEIEARRSKLPADPCFRCGERGWCHHRPDPGNG